MKAMDLVGRSLETVDENSLTITDYYNQLKVALTMLDDMGALVFQVDGQDVPFVFADAVLVNAKKVGVSLGKKGNQPLFTGEGQHRLRQFLKDKF